ncbi:MAG: hypothetical protein U0P45_11085 [Acidimicrobiales bacterium]
MSETDEPTPPPAEASDAADPGEATAMDDPIWDEPDADAPAGDVAGIPREKAIRIAQIGLVVLALLVVVVVLITKSSGSDDDKASSDNGSSKSTQTTTAANGKAKWPPTIGGRPAALGKRGQKATQVDASKAKPGAYLWNDYDGWHLWVVNGTGIGAVKGTLTSNDAVARAELAVPDAGTVSTKDKVVTFDLPASPQLTGIDFNPGFFAKNLVFTLEGPDGPLPEQVVFVGSKPTQAPFPLVISKS